MHYYDIQQSSFNSFTATDFNKIKEDVLTELKKNPIVSDLKKQAHQRFFEELSKVLVVSKQFKWHVIDKTNSIEDILLD